MTVPNWFSLDDERTVPRLPPQRTPWPVRVWRGLARRPSLPHWATQLSRHTADGDGLLEPHFLRQLESLSLLAGRANTSGLMGEHLSRRRASSVDFADYRRYVAGDDFRLIDWNVYARLGELCLKLTQARENVTLHLLLDASASMGWGDPSKLLYARRAAAALGCLALANYDVVLLTVFRNGGAQTFPPLRGRPALHRLLEYLMGIEAGGTTDLRASGSAFLSQRSYTGVALLLSDMWGVRQGPTNDTAENRPDYADALTYLRRAGMTTTLLHILDEEEIHPTLEGAVELVDVETGQMVSITITPALLAQYTRSLEVYQAAIKEICAAHAVTYVPVVTQMPIEQLVLYELRRLSVVA